MDNIIQNEDELDNFIRNETQMDNIIQNGADLDNIIRQNLFLDNDWWMKYGLRTFAPESKSSIHYQQLNECSFFTSKCSFATL